MGSRRWWALTALVLSVLVIGLDTTILNVALPTLGGALGDRYGRKLLLMIGLALFGGASVFGALVVSPGQLIAVRAVMGIGAAILTPIVMAILPVLFTEKERGKAIAVVTAGIGLGIPLGPLVGGYLL